MSDDTKESNAGTISASTIRCASYDREATARLVNGLAAIDECAEAFPQLATRESRKLLLERLGVNVNTEPTYRMIEYQSDTQNMLLFGDVQADGSLKLTRSIVIPPEWKAEKARALLEGEVKTLPAPIVIPAAAITTQPKPGDKATEPSELLLIDAQQARRLEYNLTLLALAEKANADGASGASHAGLPRRSPGAQSRTV